MKSLHAKTGKLTLENDFLRARSIARQAEALRISRGSIYDQRRSVPEADLAIMQRLDRLHLERPLIEAELCSDNRNQFSAS